MEAKESDSSYSRESNGSGVWEFQLRLVEGEIGRWFERPLAEGGGWHLERNEPAE